MDASEHNKRILEKREKDVAAFLELTGAEAANGSAYMKKHAFDLDTAVGDYFDAGGADITAQYGSELAAASSERASVEDERRIAQQQEEQPEDDMISTIMKQAKQMTPEEAADSRMFKGPGRSLGSRQADPDDLPEKKVRLTFYEDGFTAALEGAAAQKPVARRSGVHTYENSKEREIHDLPALRDYERNTKFIEDVKASRVPEEFRGPWRVSILLDDKRPAKYPRANRPGGPIAFSGSGQSLGGGPAASSAPANVAQASGGPGNTPGQRLFPRFLPAAIAYDIMCWVFLFICKVVGLTPSFSTNTRKRQRPTIDESKPTTTVSVKMASGARAQSKFNASHTVADVRRFVEHEMVQASGCALDAELPPFELASGFPPKVIVEGTPEADVSSLEQAGLLNAVIVQRLLPQHQQHGHPKLH